MNKQGENGSNSIAISLSDVIPKLAGMEQTEKKYHHRASGSTYGEKCLREQVYFSLGIPPKPFADRAMLVFNDSSWHEELTNDWIRKSIYTLHSEQQKVECYEVNGVMVTGSIDGLLFDSVNKTDILYEHKAINHFTFEAYEIGNLLPYDYVCQCVHYLVGLKKQLGLIIPAILLIKNKNTSRYIEYHIEYDDQEDIAKCRLYRMDYEGNPLGTLKEVKEFFMEQVIARAKYRFEAIDLHTREKLLPKRQYDLQNFHCQYCRWAGTCWKDYDKELDSRQDGVNVKDPDIIRKVSEYKELAESITEITKTKDKLNEELKVYFQNENIKRGMAGEFVVTLAIKESSRLNKAKIAPELIAAAMEVTKYESLTVSKLKVKKDKK